MKYALVTGGSRGIGRAICLKLAGMGIPVIINFKSNIEAARELREAILAEGGEASLMQFDVADPKAVSSALEAWENEHPDDYIAYLVNNAGIRKDNMMFMMPQEDWHSVIDTTLNGFFYVTRALLPKMMMRRHGGRIVSVSSLSGLKGMAGQTNYSTAKAALVGATKSLAQETATRNVTVNAVAPGSVCTSIPSAAHVRARRKPGSEMPGVPASLINATFNPPRIRSLIISAVWCSLNL